MKRLVIAILVLLSCSIGYTQQCSACKEPPSLANFDLDVKVPAPKLKGEQTEGWLQWLRLFWVNKHVQSILFNSNKQCIRFTQPVDTRISEEAFMSSDGVELASLEEDAESNILKVGETYTNLPPSGDLSRFGNYLMTGSVTASGSGYTAHIEIQTACSRKTIASASVSFAALESSADIAAAAQQAVSQLSPLIEKIKQFELKERKENKKVALMGNDGDAIRIKPKKTNLAIGEQTEIEISLKDCDGTPMAGREIVFTKGSLNGTPISPGTIGGTVTPSSVITDANGKAKATFKMGSGKSAIIDAYHIYETPSGCEYVKMGSTPIGGIPIRIELSYYQNEVRSLKRATLPGIKIKGGQETEEVYMTHNSIIYHYPSANAMKQGLLVATEKGDPGTEYIYESGSFSYKKRVLPALIMGMVGDKPIVAATEEGSQQIINGRANNSNHSEIMFFKGNENEPPSFSWGIEYPASGEDIAYGAASIVKGEDGTTWTVNKITDPSTPYKTEYILTLTLDATEELIKGLKAGKELFGFDVNDLSKMLDPTNPQNSLVEARGTQTMMVRILSPY